MADQSVRSKMETEQMIANLFKYKEEEDSFLDETNFSESQSDIIMARVNDMVRQEMWKVCSIWLQIGLPRGRRVERVEEIRELVEKEVMLTLTELKDVEQETLDMLKQYKLDRLAEINKMLGDLRLPPYEMPEDRSLASLAKLLHQKFAELNKLKQERLEKWAELLASKLQLSAQMGRAPADFKSATDIPSESELVELQSQVLGLNQTRNRRLEQLEQARKQLAKLFVELEHKSTGEFELSVFDKKVEFVLSDANLLTLEQLAKRMQMEREHNEKSRQRMLEKLQSLWEKLSIEASQQQPVRDLANNARPSTLARLQEEIAQLEELKRQNLSVFTQKIRPDIEIWWEKCCTAEEDMAEFMRQNFECDEYTEQLLEVHEQELDRLQTLYRENEEIFVKCGKWRAYWIRLRELEVKSKDPNRFNNRGGALLQEEKERKQLQKGIPKLESELKQLAKQWSVQHGDATFTIYGRSIERYFTDYWVMYNAQKENEKEKKKTIKKQEIEAEVRGGVKSVSNVTLKKTPQKRGNTPAVNSPATSEKQRKLDQFSSLKRSQPELEPDIIVRSTNRKNFAKNLKQDFDKICRNGKQLSKTELTASTSNFENSLVNESQFQSTRIDEKYFTQASAIDKMFNRFGFKDDSPHLSPSKHRSKYIGSSGQTPLQENKLILNSPVSKNELNKISLPKNKKPFYVN